MFIDIKSRLLEEPISTLFSYSLFPDETRLKETIEEYQTHVDLDIYGYEEDGEMIGVIGVQSLEHGNLLIRNLSVNPIYRNLGYGRGLLMELIELKKPVKVIAETDEDAVDFYRNVGFTVVSLGERYPETERFQCTYYTIEE